MNSVIDVSSRQISVRKKSFVFKSSFHCKVRANDSRTISIKCSLPKELRNGDFVSQPFRPYSNYLPLTSMLQFGKGRSFIRIANPTSRDLTIKPNTPLGCVSFELMRNLSDSSNIITHVHQDMNGSNAMCSQIMSDCPIHQYMGNAPDGKVSHTCKDPFNHKPQSHNYPTCAESMHIHRHKKNHNCYTKCTDTVFDDGQHEQMMKDYYNHNQDKMTPAQIRELIIKTFPYLDSDDVRLCMSD